VSDRGEGPLLVEVADGVAVVTLHRPEARNALNAELRRTLYRAMEDLDADGDVRCVVLTGTDPAFCAGLDLKELAAAPGSLGGGFDDRSELRRPIPGMSTPVIGAINGVAITGGFELALACDFLIASEHARFADTHARVGIMPGWGLTVALPQAVGLRRAKELSATGNFLDAATALQWGLVNHVVAHERLLPLARKLATDVAGNDAAGVRQILATYDAGALTTCGEALGIEQRNAAAWIAERGADDLESRRRAVTERGRTQL
jgi:enoyl-CoA hydratase